MRIGYYLSAVVLSFGVLSCVDKAYGLKELKDVNTDMNFGGEHFSAPIGSFAPIALGRFLQAGNMLRVTEGRYELSFQDNRQSTVPTLDSIRFTMDAIPVKGIPVDLAEVSIDDIDLPTILIDKQVLAEVPAGLQGVQTVPVPVDNQTSPVHIRYLYSQEIKQVNLIRFGAQSASEGQLIEVSVTPVYGGVLDAGSTQINDFKITFPYGFELSANPADPYHGTISEDKRSYIVSAQALQPATQMSFFADQITFNPAVDQTTKGELLYVQELVYSGNFSLAGQATGKSGLVAVSINLKEQLTLRDGRFNTNAFVSNVPQQETPVGSRKELNDPSIQNIRQVTLAQRTPVDIVLDVTGLPDRVAELTLKGYTVQFPSFMIFEDPTINASKQLVLTDAIPNGGRLNKRLYLTGFVFDQNPIQDGALVIEGSVTSSGGIALDPISDLNSSEIQDIVIKPRVTLGMMEAGVIEAVIKPNVTINPIEVKVAFPTSMDFLRQSELDLDRAALQIRVINPTGIAANIGVRLVPFDHNNQPITDHSIVQNTGMLVKPKATSELWLSNSKMDMPEGYSWVENTNTTRLFRTLPSRVEAHLSILPDEQSSVIDLTAPQMSELNIDFGLVAPIAVGKNFRLIYKERVTGLQGDLSKYLKYVSTLQMVIDATTDIPLDMVVSALALDSTGGAIPVQIGVKGNVAAGTKLGGETSSTIELSLSETEKGALARMDQIELLFVASSNPNQTGAALKDTQALKLAMRVKVPGGINISF